MVAPPFKSRLKNNNINVWWTFMLPRGWNPQISLAPPAGQSFHFSNEISQHLPNILSQNFAQTFVVLRWYILMTLVAQWVNQWSHHDVYIWCFKWNVSTNTNCSPFHDPLTWNVTPSSGTIVQYFSSWSNAYRFSNITIMCSMFKP